MTLLLSLKCRQKLLLPEILIYGLFTYMHMYVCTCTYTLQDRSHAKNVKELYTMQKMRGKISEMHAVKSRCSPCVDALLFQYLVDFAQCK